MEFEIFIKVSFTIFLVMLGAYFFFDIMMLAEVNDDLKSRVKSLERKVRELER